MPGVETESSGQAVFASLSPTLLFLLFVLSALSGVSRHSFTAHQKCHRLYLEQKKEALDRHLLATETFPIVPL